MTTQWEASSERRPTTGPQMGRWFSANSMDAAMTFSRNFARANPQAGPAIEKLVSNYPTMSADLIAGLAISGQLDADAAILDELVERDRQAQAAAASNPVYSAFKGGIRKAFVVAEDLYNNAPFMAIPRMAINMNQGMSFGDSFDKSITSSWEKERQLAELGFEANYGQGFLPSEELVPQGEGFWIRVKEMIQNGEFEGSAEEQILAGEQEMKVRQALETGFSPYALAREQWLSTMMHKMVNGEEIAVPYSPGAGVAIHFTNPGTAAYTNFSGLVDGAMRLYMEPVDIVIDNAGDLLRITKPYVTGDYNSVSRGSGMSREILSDMGVELLDDPVIITQKHVDEFGLVTESDKSVKGVTVHGPDGAQVAVDPATIGRLWDQKALESAHDLEKNIWLDPTDPYVSVFAERGLGPQEVIDELANRGGENGSLWLTIEHELVHAEYDHAWFDVTEVGDKKLVLTENVTDAAPQELKDLAQSVVDEGVTLDDVNRMGDELDALDQRIASAEAEHAKALERLNDTPRGPGRQLEQENVARWQSLVDDLNGKRTSMGDEYKAKMGRRAELDEARRSFSERHAVETSWDRMMDGSWQAPKYYRRARRKAGLTNISRPFVRHQSVTEWMQGRGGTRTAERLAGADIDVIRKHMPYLSPEDTLAMHKAKTAGEAKTIIQDAFNGYIAGAKRPTVGFFTSTFGDAMDSWSANHQFLGGRIAGSARMQGRRMAAGTGGNTLTTTNPRENVDIASNILRTVKADPDRINAVQRLLLSPEGSTTSGIDRAARMIDEAIMDDLQRVGDGLYSIEDARKMLDEWRNAEEINRKYFVSAAGKERKWLHRHTPMPGTSVNLNSLPAEAFMEAQFAQTSRVLPDVRRLRRMNSRQRTSYEWFRKRAKEMNYEQRIDGVTPWEPLGMKSSLAFRMGDFTFGIWRDLNLMRGGWALRVIPEEQLRFAASGMSSLFSNPIDYLITAFNRLDFTLKGDTMTLGDILKHQEALGAGQLRDVMHPPHRVGHESWTIAYRNAPLKPGQADPFWGGMTRELIHQAADPVLSRVARMGRDEALAWFGTKEGAAELRRISMQAKKGSSLELIPSQHHLEAYIDMAELRIAQYTGGQALWFDPQTKQWVDGFDNPVPLVNRDNFPNKASLEAAITTEAAKQGKPNPLVGPKGGTRKLSRPQLEKTLHETRGFDLNLAEKQQRAAIVIKEGDANLRQLIGNREFEDIRFLDDMAFEEVRSLDGRLKRYYEDNGVEPPQAVPISEGEMMSADQRSLYNQAADRIFHFLNGVPSRKLNRQPFFQQKFGEKVAQMYMYGDGEMRAAIDNMRRANKSFNAAYEVGERVLFRQTGLSKMPPAWKSGKVQQGTMPVRITYDDAMEAGMYDVVPLGQGGSEGHITSQFFEWMNEQGNLSVENAANRGMYAQRHGTRYGAEGQIRSVEDFVFHGSQTLKPVGDEMMDANAAIASLSDEIGALEMRADQIREAGEFDGDDAFDAVME